MTDTFQSNGLCFDNCKAKYAFAVVQGSRCWCSDYAPASATTGCDEICPGYGSESCGNTKKGLFGYIPLPNAPKGTAGGSSTVRESDSPTPAPSISTVIEGKPGPTTTVIITVRRPPFIHGSGGTSSLSQGLWNICVFDIIYGSAFYFFACFYYHFHFFQLCFFSIFSVRLVC